jgi:hypothetical protein
LANDGSAAQNLGVVARLHVPASTVLEAKMLFEHLLERFPESTQKQRCGAWPKALFFKEGVWPRIYGNVLSAAILHNQPEPDFVIRRIRIGSDSNYSASADLLLKQSAERKQFKVISPMICKLWRVKCVGVLRNRDANMGRWSVSQLAHPLIVDYKHRLGHPESRLQQFPPIDCDSQLGRRLKSYYLIDEIE